MPRPTNIGWADFSTNPFRAIDRDTGKRGWVCLRVSPGCRGCYAATLNRRLGTGRDFTVGDLSRVDIVPDDKEFSRILSFRPKPPFKGFTPRPKVFAFDITDLFGEWFSDAFIEHAVATFAQRSDVDFLLLTKRSERMRDFFRRREVPPNIWLGVSIENDDYVWRADHLRQIPAVVRFVSYEPALGPLPSLDLEGIDWVIYGGESGEKFRAHDPGWAREMRRRCEVDGISFFFKQGSHRFTERETALDGRTIREFPAPKPERVRHVEDAYQMELGWKGFQRDACR